jgi:hypothetical protein
MANEISLDTLTSMGACADGKATFKKTFGYSSVSLKTAFFTLPKKDVIWFVVNGLYSGECNPIVRQLIPTDYHPNRKRHAILWLERNFSEFLESVSSLN